MSRTLLAGIALAMSIFLVAPPLQAKAKAEESEASRIAALEERSREAFDEERWGSVYAANLKLSQLRPGETQYLVDAVRACGMLGRKNAAYHLMLEMQQMGMTFNFNHVAETEQIRGTEAYEYINDLLIDAGKPAGDATAVFSLPGDPVQFEALDWDPGREQFLVGTRAGEVLTVSESGQADVLIKAAEGEGSPAVTGLAVDASNDRLWVASSSPTAEGASPGALVEFDLRSLTVLSSYSLPADSMPRELGSVAVADDGTVYVIDRKSPVVYRKAADRDQLDVFFTSPELVALSDIAVIGDNSRIFVADAYKGVLVIDPVAEQAGFMVGPENLNLGGVRGIEYLQGQLFVVQGGYSPQRVVRLELDKVSGSMVESISPMAIALEEFNQPGVGTIRGAELVYFANSGQAGAANAVVMSTPLDAGVQVAPPDMAAFEEAIRAQAKAKAEQEEDG